MPCLSSRINHGEEVTTDKLGMIGQAELYIKELTGVRNLRVRYSNSSARIEVAPEERKLFFDEAVMDQIRSEEHTSELQSLAYLVCRLLLEKKKKPLR